MTSLIGRFKENSFLSGSALLFISMTVVNAGNYVFNLVLGRWLGPADFADLSLIVTLMLMVTFVTVTLQLTTAKFAATYEQEARVVALQKWLGRFAWGSGLLLGMGLVFGAPILRDFFRTSSALPFAILGVGLPIYFVQGVDRGILQGQLRFGRLAVSYQAEMWVRLAGGLLLVALGFSVNGAVLAMTLSFIASWLVVRGTIPQLEEIVLSKVNKQSITQFAWPVIVVNISQILINNSDILLVKRFYVSEDAGHYAALALIGRVIFFATWSVVTTLFPIVAAKHNKGEPHRHLLFIGLGIVAAVSAAIMVGTVFFDTLIVTILFGSAYLVISPLLWLYALATTLYALANVVVTYRLSADNTTGATIAVIAGIAQILAVVFFHDTLRQVVLSQIVVMGSFLLVLMLWDFSLSRRERAVPIAKPS